jgi:hypothetical protein
MTAFYNPVLKTIYFQWLDAGGAEGNRTPDLVIANDALSQLSYSPISGNFGRGRAAGRPFWEAAS